MLVINFKSEYPFSHQEKIMKVFENEDIIFSPTFINCNTKYKCAQDFSLKERTPGLVTSVQLIDQDVKYAFVGHLERRLSQYDTLESVIEKFKYLISDTKIIPILCIGIYEDIEDNLKELELILNSVDIDSFKVCIAYEHIKSTQEKKILYDEEIIKRNLLKIKEFMKKKYNKIDYKVIFGGGVNKNIINNMDIKIDGFLIGDRYRDYYEIKSLLNAYKRYKKNG